MAGLAAVLSGGIFSVFPWAIRAGRLGRSQRAGGLGVLVPRANEQTDPGVLQGRRGRVAGWNSGLGLAQCGAVCSKSGRPLLRTVSAGIGAATVGACDITTARLSIAAPAKCCSVEWPGQIIVGRKVDDKVKDKVESDSGF